MGCWLQCEALFIKFSCSVDFTGSTGIEGAGGCTVWGIPVDSTCIERKIVGGGGVGVLVPMCGAC